MPNRLATANSPYLLQHAANPVDWFEWGPEALELATRTERPLLISIGYAACHWCHVMAHESFEDEATAAVMNEHFVCIKVDREERPDLDAIYMAATQAATGHGGWPMTVFATPDGRPFYAGTYFPPVERHSMPSFTRVLEGMADAWNTRRTEVEAQATALADAVVSEASYADRLATLDAPAVTLDSALDSLARSLAERFDADHGGFGPAPKFPRPSYIEALFVHHLRSGDLHSRSMATTTLDNMARGGIYDHLAGGFARYSVDPFWLVPHFEKMLTDQALLARVYLHAFQLTDDPAYAQVVVETLDWVLDGLGLAGGLASSVDADAGGVEGSHATFTTDEVTAALTGQRVDLDAAAIVHRYGITPAGTFEHGRSVLALDPDASLLRTEAEESARRVLLAVRQARIQPGVDDKVLVEWNAMAASVLAEAAGVLGTHRFAQAARDIAKLLDEHFRDDNGRLLRAGRGGSVAHLGLLGDHAWLCEAMGRLYELDGDDHWLWRAHRVAEEMLALFFDGPVPTPAQPNQGGGFFTTGEDAEVLLVRSKEIFDGALPSQSAVAATALARLAGLSGDAALGVVAERTVTLLRAALAEMPLAVPDLVLALGWLDHMVEVAIPGPPGPLLEAARGEFAPFTLFAHGAGTGILLAGRTPSLAYVCRGRVCDQPVSEPLHVAALLAGAVRG